MTKPLDRSHESRELPRHVKAFLDMLAEIVADQILKEIRENEQSGKLPPGGQPAEMDGESDST